MAARTHRLQWEESSDPIDSAASLSIATTLVTSNKPVVNETRNRSTFMEDDEEDEVDHEASATELPLTEESLIKSIKSLTQRVSAVRELMADCDQRLDKAIQVQTALNTIMAPMANAFLTPSHLAQN